MPSRDSHELLRLRAEAVERGLMFGVLGPLEGDLCIIGSRESLPGAGSAFLIAGFCRDRLPDEEYEEMPRHHGCDSVSLEQRPVHAIVLEIQHGDVISRIDIDGVQLRKRQSRHG